MFPFDIDRVFVNEDVYRSADAAERAKRMVAALGVPEVRFRPQDVGQLIRDNDWLKRGVRFGTLDHVTDPDLVLTVSEWSTSQPDALAQIKEQDPDVAGLASRILATGLFKFFCSNKPDLTPNPYHVCRPAWRIDTSRGCPHRCAYCGCGGVVATALDMDVYGDHLAQLIEHNPWEKTYLLNDVGETLINEPEAGALATMAECVAKFDDRYLVVHTKSDNVYWMADFPHPDRVIMLWSLAAPRASRLIEPSAATCEGRVEAGRWCQEHGFPIRYKIKPMVPIVGWREDCAEMVRLLMTRTRPELINLFTVAWMDVDELKGCIRTAPIDPELLAMAEEYRDMMKDRRTGPLPPRARAIVYDFLINEIRQYDTDVPIAFSTESLEMWRMFGERLGYGPADYVCGCGAQATPGLKRLPASPWTTCKPRTFAGEPVAT